MTSHILMAQTCQRRNIPLGYCTKARTNLAAETTQIHWLQGFQLGSAISPLWVSQAQTEALTCLSSLSSWGPREESASSLIEVVGRMQFLNWCLFPETSLGYLRPPAFLITFPPLSSTQQWHVEFCSHRGRSGGGVSLTSPTALLLNSSQRKFAALRGSVTPPVFPTPLPLNPG